MGFWVGAFETFGGFVARRRVFSSVTVSCVLLIAALTKYGLNFNICIVLSSCVVAYSCYFFGTMFGQTYYFRPSGLTDAIETFSLAVQGRL